MRDPYTVLGVRRDTDDTDLKRAYRSLAKRYHPDLHPGDRSAESRFQEIQAAYRLLRDAELRRRYDRGEIDANGDPRFSPFDATLRQAASSKATARAKAGGESPAGAARSEREDLFADLLASLKRARKADGAATPAQRLTITISAEEAARGVKRPVTLANGQRVAVTVPAGVANGQILRLRDTSPHAGRREPAGDIEVEIRVEAEAAEAPQARPELDVRRVLAITLADAVLGGKALVPSENGDLLVTIPPGSDSGTVLKLRGKGLQAEGGARGDVLVELRIMLPERLDPDLVAFIRDWSMKRPYRARG